MSSIDIRNMSALILGLISLGLSLAIVLSSLLWWVQFSGGNPLSRLDSETRGFPIPYYRVIYYFRWIPRNASSAPFETFPDFEFQTLAVDIILIFILFLGILTLLRWRALSRPVRRRI